MAEITKAGPYAAIEADDDHWTVPQTAMFVTLASGGSWALILFGVRWLIG